MLPGAQARVESAKDQALKGEKIDSGGEAFAHSSARRQLYLGVFSSERHRPWPLPQSITPVAISSVSSTN